MKSNTEQLKIAEKYLGDSCRTCCGMPNNCCSYFVSKIFKSADNASLFYGGKTVTYVPNAMKWCKTVLANIPIYLAMPSDIVIFDWNGNGVPDHIGFVRERVSDQVVDTLEGNTTSSGIVARRTRTVKYIAGCFRPHFKGAYDISKPLEIDGQFGYSSIAMLQLALGVKVDGILGKDTVKALQKKAGTSADGDWGRNTSIAVQKMIGVTADGWFGEASVKALQRWINSHVTIAPKQKPKVAYSGKYPSNLVMTHHASEINAKALEFAFAYGTPKSRYTYPKAKPIEACKQAIAKVWHTATWSKQMRYGADCAIFVGSVLGILGLGRFDQHAEKMIKELDKSKKFRAVSGTDAKDVKAGTIGAWTKKDSQHVFIVVEKNDVKYIAEASHRSKYYGRLSKKAPKYNRDSYKTFQFYEPVEEVARTYLGKGDEGKQVQRLQAFINWFFGKKVLEEDGHFGTQTEKYLKKMQTKLGIPSDGYCGEQTVKAMKAVRK